jgi:hypothetical protein
MARKPKEGDCHICGKFGKLSFEHVPPRAAFNNHPIVLQGIDEILKRGEQTKTKGKIFQRGAGAYTLCERCNSLTGHWYGKNYVDWVYQGMEKLVIARKVPTLYYNFHLLPLRVIKQIACMFFSVNSPQFRKAQPDLERFVLDKKCKYLPPHLRIFTFYAVGGVRQAGITGRLSTDASAPTTTCSEIVFPPFGYTLVFDHTPDKRLLDISWFGKFGYDDYRAIPLQIPVLSAISYLPGDYRTQEEIDKTIALNKQIPRDDIQAENAARRISEIFKK